MMLWFKGTLLLLALCVLHDVSAQRRTPGPRRRSEQDILQRILDPASYDSRVNPGGVDADGPVNVSIQLYVRDVFEIDEKDQEWGVQLILRQRWTDGRLTYTKPNSDLKYVTVSDISKIWRPDLFVGNSRKESQHDYVKPNQYVRIFPNGSVLHSERITLKLACPMDTAALPFDVQRCKIQIASYAHTKDDIAFSWRDDDPVGLKKSGYALREFTVNGVTTESCDSQTATGVYSCVEATFELQRQGKYYLIQLYIPVLMLVIVAYLVFWLEPKNILVRIIIALASLYVAATSISTFSKGLPKVHNKVLDWYTGVGLTFIFVAVIETIVVYNLSRKEEAQGEEDPAENNAEDPEAQQLKPESDEGKAEGGAQGKTDKKGKKFNARPLKSYLSRFQRKSDRIDAGFRVGYPLAFILFVALYLILVLV